MSASRNLGLRRAAGSYAAFLDADDVWMPDKLKQQRQLIGAHPQAAMVYGPALYWFDWTGKTEDQDKNFKQDIGFPGPGLFSRPNWLGCICVIPTSFLRQARYLSGSKLLWLWMDLSKSLGALFTTTKSSTRSSRFRMPVLIDDECCYKYRQHFASGCTIASRSNLVPLIRIQFLVWLRDYIAENDIDDITIKKMIAKELRSLTGWQVSLRSFARSALPSRLRKFLRSRIANPQS